MPRRPGAANGYSHLRSSNICLRYAATYLQQAGVAILTMHSETGGHFAFDNSYARLPGRFYARLAPTATVSPTLVRLNEKLARHLNLDPASLATPDGVAILEFPAEASRSPWLMPGINLVASYRSSVTAAPFCSAKL
jgi:hypothetical protein